jgi:8-oxo-dGTP pyrophosphatase MutT (NUDIX family)
VERAAAAERDASPSSRMSVPAAEGCERLLRRLAGTTPQHGIEHMRMGAGMTEHVDPRLQALIPPDLRASAVLIGLIDNPTAPGVLLTVRAAHLRHHAGQISFPGGVIETGDADPAAAALREAAEEVGLAPEQVQVVGYLPDHLVLTGFRITPVVARIAAGFVPRLDTSEVESTFVLPFAALLDAANERHLTRSIAGIEVAVRDLHFGEHRIWGATAGMLFGLRELALP